MYLALLEIVCPQRQRKRLTLWILSANMVKNRNQTNETENSSTLCFILLLVQQEEISLHLPTAALQCHTQAALDLSLRIGNKKKAKLEGCSPHQYFSSQVYLKTYICQRPRNMTPGLAFNFIPKVKVHTFTEINDDNIFKHQ